MDSLLSLSPVRAVSSVAATQSVSVAQAKQAASKAAQSTGASREMPDNAAAAAIAQARSEEKNVKTGAVTDSRAMAAKVQAEFDSAPPSIVETMIRQAVGGAPGATVTDLARFIDQTAPDQQPVDLAQSRLDVPAQISQMRRIGEQTLREGAAQRAEARQTDALGQMTERIMAPQGQQGAYSTLSLAAVSHEAQIGRRIRLSL